MSISRRCFLQSGAVLCASPAILAARPKLLGKLKIGVTDWNLRQTGKLEALSLSAALGFEGVEVSLGRKPEGDRLPLSDAGFQRRYVAEAKRRKIGIAGT